MSAEKSLQQSWEEYMDTIYRESPYTDIGRLSSPMQRRHLWMAFMAGTVALRNYLLTGTDAPMSKVQLVLHRLEQAQDEQRDFINWLNSLGSREEVAPPEPV